MKAADLVLFSEAIFDSVKDTPFPGGIAIFGDKILFAGSKEDALEFIGPGTQVRDYGDRLIMPGICDGHAHLDGTANKQYAEVAGGLDQCRSEEECVEAVKAFAASHPGLKRINGISWLLTNWGPNPKKPTKASLDKAFPDIPVYLLGADGHSNWINSKAIAECNLEEIVRQYPDVSADLAPRDENGEFTGFLAERICHIVNAFAEKYSQEQRAAYHTKTIRDLNACGITGFTDVTPMPASALTDYYRCLKDLENKSELTIRCYAWAGMGPSDMGDAGDIEKVRLFEPFMCSDKLRIAGVKTLIDGIPFGHTSAMLEPYADKPDVKGAFLHPPEVYHRWVTAVNKMGYGVKIHCTGDAAVRLALDSFEISNAVNGKGNLRNAVEHMDIVPDEDIQRFASLGVVAGVQPAHVVMTKGIYSYRIGERSRLEWNFRRLIDAGAILSVGTDSPVVSFNPFHTIYKAVTRRDLDGVQYSPYSEDQAMTLPEVLKGYTINSAYASNMERKVGTLEAGKYADIIVVDRDLFRVPVDEIKDSRVICTVFDGRVVYEAH